MIVKRYLDDRFGQLHLRENSTVGGPPLICLHATAYSSRSFAAFLEALDGRRYAIAVDTPGYGGSDAPTEQIDLAGYADAIAEALLAEHQTIDVLGYHTGVYLALEMAIRHPDRVRRIVLAGIPYFQAIGFEEWKAKLTQRHVLSDDLAQFDERWNFLVAGRAAGLSLQRGFENFVDELSAWPNGWWTHEALFAYNPNERLPRIVQPVLVLNPAGHLAIASRAASALIPKATVEELPEFEGAVFDRYPGALAASVNRFLNDGAGGSDPARHDPTVLEVMRK